MQNLLSRMKMFVDGRGPLLTDVILDTCGVAAGCLLASAFHRGRTERASKDAP